MLEEMFSSFVYPNDYQKRKPTSRSLWI